MDNHKMAETWPYQTTKWSQIIDTALYWIRQGILAEVDNTDAFQDLHRWTTWMIQEGHALSDTEVTNKTLEYLSSESREHFEQVLAQVNALEART